MTQPTRQNVAVSYALLGAVVLSLWAISNPVAGVLGVAALVGLVQGARRTAGLARCLRDCGAFAFDLAGDVRVTVSRRSAGVGRTNKTPDSSGTASCC